MTTLVREGEKQKYIMAAAREEEEEEEEEEEGKMAVMVDRVWV
jgi:hypothetical protein